VKSRPGKMRKLRINPSVEAILLPLSLTYVSCEFL